MQNVGMDSLVAKINRSSSETEIGKSNINSRNKSLLWYQWVNSPILEYLHLIDSKRHKNYLKSLPWYNIALDEEAMLRYCQSTVYDEYKPHILRQITKSDMSLVPYFLEKLLHISEIYGINSNYGKATKLYSEIVCCLFDKGCYNPSTLLKVWDRLCSKCERTRITVFDSVIGKHRKHRAAKVLRYILSIAQTVRFDFWGAWIKGHMLENFSFCPVTSALLNGDVEQMINLLQYGFEQNSQRMFTYDEYFLSSINSLYNWLKRPLERGLSNRIATVTEVLIFLVLIANCESYSKRVALVKCFHLLWNTVPVSFVTKAELQEEVLRRFQSPPNCSRFFPNTEYQFLQLCEFYDVICLEDISEMPQPRSLQHLCKCSVRDALYKAWNLPSGIEVLPIPRLCKIYLNVSW